MPPVKEMGRGMHPFYFKPSGRFVCMFQEVRGSKFDIWLVPKGSRGEKPERALALFPWSGMREVTEASCASTDSGAEARFLGTNVVPGMVIVRDLLETVLPRKTVGQYDLRKRRCNGGLQAPSWRRDGPAHWACQLAVWGPHWAGLWGACRSLPIPVMRKRVSFGHALCARAPVPGLGWSSRVTHLLPSFLFFLAALRPWREWCMGEETK